MDTNTQPTTNQQQYYQQPYYPLPYQPLPKPENKFKPDVTDAVFALIMFAIGYLFSRWVLFVWTGWGVAAFTTAYLLAVTAYLIKKNTFNRSAETWFWLSITFLVGLSYALWDNAGFNGRRSLFLFCLSTYYIIVASGNALQKKTGNYLLVDGFKAVVLIPFRNFINQYTSFKAFGQSGKRGKILPILIGVVAATIITAIVVPMLRLADSGGFTMITDYIADAFRFVNIANIIIYIMFGVPVAAYIYGLISGAVHKKGTDIIKPDSAKATVDKLRVLHAATIYTVLGAICVVYAVFIAAQLPYFFSAFTGSRPEGWLSYSEYARQGFFELSTIAGINLAVITLGNIFSKKQRMELRGLKAFNIALAVITLILIATAFSKMVLYIDALGLTMPRLLPCVFMVFLAAVFIALIALQKWSFSIVRFAILTGSAIMCTLCLSNPDALVVKYNSDRYLNGTLSEYDTSILYRAESAGVLPALDVYGRTTDADVKANIERYLAWQREDYEGLNLMISVSRFDSDRIGGGVSVYSIESYRARVALIER